MPKTNNQNLRDRRNSNPPGTWVHAREGVQRVLAPVERFLAVEAASGIVLMVAAIAALVWANSPWRNTYADLWHIPIGFRLGAFSFERDLHFWINDGLMTVFFFVVGLEIRREIYCGELSEIRRAALPLAAAFGGMLVPAGIFLSLNAGRSSAGGWAVAVATDIAFAVGVLALLGKRVVPPIRILVLALAVIDDVGAIVVIALFYSSGLTFVGFIALVLGIAVICFMQVLGIRLPLAYIAPAILIWAGAYIGGIHPTLAGVIVGFMTPATAWFGAERFLDQTESRIRALRSKGSHEAPMLLPELKELQVANREAVSPIERLQYQLHGLVAFGVMPLFAFANAGVPVGEISFEGDGLWVFWGIMLGLMIGKPVGILGLSWLTARNGMTRLPHGVRWPHIALVGLVGGIGFTMALFIAQLAFVSGPLLEVAKLAILCGSSLAIVLSVFAGYRILNTEQASSAGTNESDTEASTLK